MEDKDNEWKKDRKGTNVQSSPCMVVLSFSIFTSSIIHRDPWFFYGIGAIRLPKSKCMLEGPYLETLTNWSNPQDSKKICGSRSPLGIGDWWLSSYVLQMRPDILGAQYTSLSQIPVDTVSYASYVIRGWFGIAVKPSLLHWLPKTSQRDRVNRTFVFVMGLLWKQLFQE